MTTPVQATQFTPRRRWYQRRWVQLLLGAHLALLLLLSYPGYAFYRSWIQPDRAQPAWNGPLTQAQRSEIYDSLGREVDRLYPYFAEKGVDWPSALAQFRERALAAPDDRGFYLVLAELLATLKDGHTNLASYPGKEPTGSPGLRLLYTEGKYAVATVKEGVEPQVHPGDVLLSVDGRTPDSAAPARRSGV